MALTAQEKAKIVVHLGWPAKTIVEDSTDYSKIFVNRLDNLTAPFEAELRILLAKILKVDNLMEDGQERLGAKSIDTIVTRDDELYQLRKEKKRLLRQVSSLLDLEIMGQGNGGIGVFV